MKKLVKFYFESNVISAGIKTNNNFIRTEDVINGAVVRTAFANDILLDCEYAEEKINGRQYWLAERDAASHPYCAACENKEICRKFSDMSFSFMVPENSIPAPFTSKACKSCGTAHPIMDTIMRNGALSCKQCGGRMENLKGIIDKDSYFTIKVKHSTSTHTAIDLNTRTAKEGSLFSVTAIRRGAVYECEIDDCDSGMIYKGNVIYLGKYSSCGFGKMRIISVDNIPVHDTAAAIKSMNLKFPSADGREYASILFLSSAKLDIDTCGTAPLTSAEYKKIWKARLFGEDAPVEVEQVYAQNIPYHGFDTSLYYKNSSRSRTEILTEGGSSVKVSFEKGSSEAVRFLEQIEEKGIGRDTNIGYGKVMVCADIHMIGTGGKL